MGGNMKTAVGYIRFARFDPGEELSEVLQREKIQKVADRSGMVIVDWYVDRGLSGITLDREALQRLLDASQSDERHFEEVIVLSWSVLSRSLGDLLTLGSLFEAAGVKLVSVTEGSLSSRIDRLNRVAAGIYELQEAVEGEALGSS